MTPYAKRLLERTAAAAPPKPSSASVARADGPAAAPAALAAFGHWLKVKVVAEYLGISAGQVSVLRESCVMEGINIAVGQPDGVGADWRISKTSVLDFEAGRHNKAAP